MLINDFHDNVYRYSYRLTGKQSEAEDNTQQTFLIAHQKLAQLKNPESARSWLLTIARNCFLKRTRAKKSHSASSIELDIEQVTQPQLEENEELFDPGALQSAIKELDEHHRIVIMMFYFENLSYREIADALDVKVGTVMSRLSRAKTKLRQSLLRLLPSENRSPSE